MLFGMRRGEGLVCRCVTNDIETLITALYVKIDDELGGPRWLGRPRLLRVAFAVLLGAAAVPGVHPRRDADLVGAGRPEAWRAGGAGRDAGSGRGRGRRA